MAGFITRTRQETGADKPKFGGGGSWVDADAMVAREAVFGISKVEWDGENMYDGKPRPRWVLDIFPWYEGETLPGKADDSGRITQLDVAKLGLASHQSRDDFMDQLQAALEDQQDKDPDFAEGPGVLVKIRVPGGRGGRYIDLCEWDEENERPILSKGAEVAPDDEPRRPTGRNAPSRRQQAEPARGSSRRRQAEPEDDDNRGDDNGQEEERPSRSRRRSDDSDRGTSTGSRRRSPSARTSSSSDEEEPAPARGSSGFADAGGAESDGRKAVPAPAGLPISAADLKIVSDLVGGDAYSSEEELAEEYELDEGKPFPDIKQWLTDHGFKKGTDFPVGRGRIKPQYRDAYSIALRAWMEVNGCNALGEPVEDDDAPQDNASRTSPNPAVRDGTVTPSGAEHTRRQRTVRQAEVPENAHHQDDDKRPADAPVRPEDKAAWMPPDQRERGNQPASEHVYEPGDVGDSVEACPGCNVVVTGRALPMGGGSFGIMHQCEKDNVLRPLQARNIRKG